VGARLSPEQLREQRLVLHSAVPGPVLRSVLQLALSAEANRLWRQRERCLSFAFRNLSLYKQTVALNGPTLAIESSSVLSEMAGREIGVS
jgi:hypothetical protein